MNATENDITILLNLKANFGRCKRGRLIHLFVGFNRTICGLKVEKDYRPRLDLIGRKFCPKCFFAVPGINFDPEKPMCQDDYEYFTKTGRYQKKQKKG